VSAAEAITQDWRQRLQQDLPDQSAAVHDALLQWLLGEHPERLDQLTAAELALTQQAMAYRYRILQQTYWGLPPERAYQALLKKLSGLFLIRSKIRTWITLSRDRQRTVKDVLQEVLQEMLQSDRHLQQQLSWINRCTRRDQLRNLLTLATLEEYSLRPIRQQPLLVYRFVNYLRRSQRGGMTQVPSDELIQLISEEIGGTEADGSLSLFDVEAVSHHQTQAQFEAQQRLREQVKQSFSDYLATTLGETARQWLRLHLQGYPQESIAERLNLSAKQAYRLREKISYHAIRIFTLKEAPELVCGWLHTSLQEHNLGLTPSEWQTYWSSLTPEQQTLLSALKAGRPVDAIAQQHPQTAKQVMNEWVKLYLSAQALRGQRDP
jgi:DNA-binding NarL/FixJ family response regulator